jgi:hypothetical protein
LWQRRHRPRSNNQLSTGTLSRGVIAASHPGQWLGGDTID